jgi:hypothetical protein
VQNRTFAIIVTALVVIIVGIFSMGVFFPNAQAVYDKLPAGRSYPATAVGRTTPNRATLRMVHLQAVNISTTKDVSFPKVDVVGGLPAGWARASSLPVVVAPTMGARPSAVIALMELPVNKAGSLGSASRTYAKPKQGDLVTYGKQERVQALGADALLVHGRATVTGRKLVSDRVIVQLGERFFAANITMLAADEARQLPMALSLLEHRLRIHGA